MASRVSLSGGRLRPRLPYGTGLPGVGRVGLS
jgi:hypothetical protein